jgi:glycosyltransferase involved in cell wall biosynthesis
VGSHPPSPVVDLGRIDGVSVHANVPDVGPFYRRADAAVVALRAGGGTRVKILEAFAHGVPVVSTPVGAEGIDAIAGRHLLVGDDPAALAGACHQLLTDPVLAERLQTEAFALVSARYDVARIGDRIRTLVGELAPASGDRD